MTKEKGHTMYKESLCKSCREVLGCQRHTLKRQPFANQDVHVEAHNCRNSCRTTNLDGWPPKQQPCLPHRQHRLQLTHLPWHPAVHRAGSGGSSRNRCAKISCSAASFQSIRRQEPVRPAEVPEEPPPRPRPAARTAHCRRHFQSLCHPLLLHLLQESVGVCSARRGDAVVPPSPPRLPPAATAACRAR